jgi:hypothetical protein
VRAGSDHVRERRNASGYKAADDGRVIDYGEFFATGLIAGGAVVGMIIALCTIRWEPMINGLKGGDFLTRIGVPALGGPASLLVFIGLAYLLFRSGTIDNPKGLGDAGP